MNAVVWTEYGSPDVLILREVETPVPRDNEVLVKVLAASLNAADVETMRGPFIIRLAGLLRPAYRIPGSDIAGRVEAVGRNATQFEPGDAVFGDLSVCGFGAFAEYACAPESALAKKPESMTFEEAAAYPQAAVLAVQGLRYGGQVQSGQKVMINGAGGGVGTFAVQIAKKFGADVTAVDSMQKLDMLHSIGADHVIDYEREDFTKNGQFYDLILDVVVHRSVSDYARALSPEGTCGMVGGSMARIFMAMLLGARISGKENKKVGIVMHQPNKKEDLVLLKELFDSGDVVPVIDRRYSLREVADAFRYLEEGRAKGKVIVTVEDEQ
jgi:NADPH:quinone reductase-like Zn-dependent oxidoreductase